MPMPYKDKHKLYEAQKRYRQRKKEEIEAVKKAFNIILEGPTEKTITELLEEAGDDTKKLLALYRDHLRKEPSLEKLPKEALPYYTWVQVERKIRYELFDFLIRRSEAVLKEEVKAHV